MSFFRDDFKPIHNGRRLVHTNFPKAIYGQLVKRFIPEEYNHIEIIQMDSGVSYYRHLTLIQIVLMDGIICIIISDLIRL